MDVLTRWVKRFQGQSPASRGCLGCGRCCISFGGHLRASPADLARWAGQGRQDLLAGVNRLGWIWTDPQTGRPLSECPHLVRQGDVATRCAIHETKPDMCRDYPTLAHARRCLNGVFLSLPLLVWEVLTASTGLGLEWIYLA